RRVLFRSHAAQTAGRDASAPVGLVSRGITGTGAGQHLAVVPRKPAPFPGVTMFLSQEDFATVVRSTPLISIDLIVENERGEFLLGKRTNRPAQGFWFVPGGRVQKDETLTDAFERLTLAELGLQLPMAAGQFYGVWQHFYDDNFSGTGFSTHYIVLGFRLKVSEADLRLPDSQHDDYRWLTPEALLASDNVHDNSRAYFLAERQAEVPGL